MSISFDALEIPLLCIPVALKFFQHMKQIDKKKFHWSSRNFSGDFPGELPGICAVFGDEPSLPILLHSSNVDILVPIAQCHHSDTSEGEF